MKQHLKDQTSSKAQRKFSLVTLSCYVKVRTPFLVAFVHINIYCQVFNLVLPCGNLHVTSTSPPKISLLVDQFSWYQRERKKGFSFLIKLNVCKVTESISNSILVSSLNIIKKCNFLVN